MGSTVPKHTISSLISSNDQWASHTNTSQPNLFKSCSEGQSPEILWIGCSDSRVCETQLLRLGPGDVFVHRNIANVLYPQDMSANAVIEYAVKHLKVKRVIVCGHVSCGGVAAALGNSTLGGVLDGWLAPVRTIRKENSKLLEGLGEKDRALRLVELNVKRSVGVLMENKAVIDAIADRGLEVHGCIYDVSTGKLRDLDIKEEEEEVSKRIKAFELR